MEDILTKVDSEDKEPPVFSADDIQTVIDCLPSSSPSTYGDFNDVLNNCFDNSQQQVVNSNSNPNRLEACSCFQDKMSIGRVNTGQKLKQRAEVIPTLKSPAFSHATNKRKSFDQLIVLETEFRINKYLTKHKRCEMAKTLNMTELQIKAWFQNRRQKLKKMQRENNVHNFPTRLNSPYWPQNKLSDVRTRFYENIPPAYSDHVAGIQQIHASYINSRPTSYTDNEYNIWAPYCYPEAISYSSTVNQKNSPNYPGRDNHISYMQNGLNDAHLPKNFLNAADNSNWLDQNLTSSNPLFNEVTSTSKDHHTTSEYIML